MLLNKKQISHKLAKLLACQNSSFEIYGDNPFEINFNGEKIVIYIKNITDTYMGEKAKGNRRVQLPFRHVFHSYKEASTPFVFLGYDSENETFASWQSSIIKEKLNSKRNVTLYPRIHQLETARTEEDYKCVDVDGEGTIIAFPCEKIVDFLSRKMYSIDANNLVKNKQSTKPFLTRIDDLKTLARLKKILCQPNPDRCKAHQIVWERYGETYPLMTLSQWGKIFDSIIASQEKDKNT